ncbi:MAG TPA: carbohydrate-binding domain-containing protein [Deltaproteobacteria bacterium]|nr:carbohydrate-binding domain-containing protein [Deltaproteobacteria bacterium]HPR55139.1 carbohydrate-binding domain-containing protein [Deltaproteobacteria bacterium]HXK47279.1 carbohydrate-binding domain-containing protein [Deltaproteobacteria bacterium]
MKIRQVLCILFAIMLLLSVGACGSSSSGSSDSSSDDTDTSGDDSTYTPIDVSLYAVSVAESADTYDADDLVDNTTFDYTISIDFTENTARLSTGSAQTITTEGITVLTVDDTSVTVTETDYGITVSSTVDAAVTYELTGELDGTLTLSSENPYQLYLDGVDISATAGPALDLESDQKVFIVSATGTTNTLADSSSRSMTMKAALYGKGPMVFSGDGTLAVTGSYKHGIFSNDYIRVCGATLDVNVSARDAVRSVNGFIFDDGDLTITATGTTTDDESKGIKVEGDDDSTDGADKGYIVINGGYITVTSVGKAITAAWDIDEDLGENSTGNPDPYVEINNGVIDITTTGTPYETSTASCSPEGIEGKASLTINSGYITIDTTEDGLNAGGAIVINGGYLYCYGGTDAIDANGTLTITGGVVVAIGASSPEGPFDCDNNTFAITGGTVVGIGGVVSTPTSSACTQNVVVLGSITKGSTMAIEASDGTVVLAYTIPKTYTTMLLSSPDIATGTKYTVYSGGTASYVDDFGGLYLGDLDYSGGTAGSSFTVSSHITKIGGSYF